MLAQDYAFGRDGVKAYKEALAAVGSNAKIVHEEYAPQQTTDFTAPAQRLFDALKDKPGRKIIAIIWAGPNILPVMKSWKAFPGTMGAIYYYYGFPENKMNNWLVAEHQKRYGMPPDFFTAGGVAAASAIVTAITKAGSTDTEKLISTMEGMSFDTPKGQMTFRREDHQALQSMYEWRIKEHPTSEWDLLDFVREIPAITMPIPIRNK